MATQLSQELMFATAMISGGAPVSQAVSRLSVIEFNGAKELPPLRLWREELICILQEAEKWGAPCGSLLQDAARFVREDERRFSKLKALERQFSFQGAVVVVLPWSVLAFSGEASVSFMTAVGAAFQVVGLALFTFLVRRIQAIEKGEVPLLRRFCIGFWFRLQAGSSSRDALLHTLEVLNLSSKQKLFKTYWTHWYNCFDHENLEAMAWPRSFSHSQALSVALVPLVVQGAPLGSFLRSYADYLEGRRQAEWEERMGLLPSYLSLLFCAFLGPAVFLILMASVWTKLNALSM